jgi:hypothetical protein
MVVNIEFNIKFLVLRKGELGEYEISVEILYY